MKARARLLTPSARSADPRLGNGLGVVVPLESVLGSRGEALSHLPAYRLTGASFINKNRCSGSVGEGSKSK